MKEFFRRHHRSIFYGSWIILGLVQAAFTPLEDDEAYYWVYSKFLAWGYFDHPPMIGLLIKAGYAMFQNELGVRLLTVFMSGLSLFLIEKIVQPKRPFLFYAIILSIGAFQVAGFMAVPDAPLIFFTAAFFWCYKKFTEDRSLFNSFLLGIVTALLLYSKYHGVLVVLFTLLSNLKLLRSYPVYIAGTVALLCFMPHMWWQYQHGWPSVQYHLFERNAVAYRASFTLEYIAGQVLITGPLAGFILLPACIYYKTQNEIEKALRYTLIGILVFFLISTFKSRVETNWTAPILIPLIALSYFYLVNRPKWTASLLKILPYTLIMVLFVRISMVIDWVPLRFFKTRYHSWSHWPQEMNKKTGGLPVVFSDSHQQAAKYWFYTGVMAYSQQDYQSRRSNYNFWPIEDSLLGKPVYFLVTNNRKRLTDSMKTSIGNIGIRFDPQFASFAKLNLVVEPKKITALQGREFTLHCKLQIPEEYERFIRSGPELTDSTRIGVFNKKGWKKDILTPLKLRQMIDRKEFSISMKPRLPKGSYYMLFSIKDGYYNGTHNSEKVKLIIE